MKRSAAGATGNWLIFVDTNVLLDFYRLSGESADRALRSLEKHKDSLILNDQIYMEFLKNRQKVIVDGLKDIGKPQNPKVPSVVVGTQYYKTWQGSIKTALEKHTAVMAKINKILVDPSKNDPVFQAINRIYGHNGKFHIKRPQKERFKIRNAARKRFMLGYPPRKKDDTSIGDAVNWETIIHCAQSSADKHNVLIVSRDNDYGVTYDNTSVINDWLRKELKDRVSKKRTIELTTRLTYALKRLDETVAPEDEAAENKLLGSGGASLDTAAGEGASEV